jgi:hypothetical protein
VRGHFDALIMDSFVNFWGIRGGAIGLISLKMFRLVIMVCEMLALVKADQIYNFSL